MILIVKKPYKLGLLKIRLAHKIHILLGRRISMKVEIKLKCECGMEDTIPLKYYSETKGLDLDYNLDLTGSIQLSDKFKLGMYNPETFSVQCKSCNKEVEIDV